MKRGLPKRKMYRYCLADIAKGLFNGMIGNYLLYFFQPTVQSGLPALLPQSRLFGFITIMALLTGTGKLIDAVTDPLVAGWSDKCQHAEGRRMPFMRRAALPYALSILLIFFAPFAPGSFANAVWVGVFLAAYYVCYTLFFIPRNALVPEIIPDAQERVGYYAVSTAFFMGASSFMYAATLFVDVIKKTGLSVLTSWRLVFALFACIGALCLLLSAYAFDEKEYTTCSHRPTESVLQSFGTVMRNRDFCVVSLGDLFSGIAMAFFQSSMLYYITILLHVPESRSFLVMLTAIAAALCFFPLIVKMSQKVGKKPLLFASGIIFTIVYTFIFFGDQFAAMAKGHELLLGLGMGLAVAFPFASINILPQSVVSDIIQQDSILHGVNREGIFSAVKTFIEKIASACAMIGVSSILAIGAVQGSSVGLLGVKLTGAIAGLFSVISLVFLSMYNEKKVLKMIAGEKHEEKSFKA